MKMIEEVKTTGKRRFSFLAGGPQFEIELPMYFDAPPELDSPLFNGIGGRSFTFLPKSRDEGIGDDHSFLGTLVDADGRSVEFYARIDPPTIWLLRWELSNGILYTHLREEDGVKMGETTVKSISIVEDSGTGTPFLLPTAPLRYAASAAPGYQESAMYFSAERGDGWLITLTRPGFMSVGSIAVAPTENTGGLVLMRAGLGHGMELSVWAGPDAVAGGEILALAMGSLVEG